MTNKFASQISYFKLIAIFSNEKENSNFALHLMKSILKCNKVSCANKKKIAIKFAYVAALEWNGNCFSFMINCYAYCTKIFFRVAINDSSKFSSTISMINK